MKRDNPFVARVKRSNPYAAMSATLGGEEKQSVRGKCEKKHPYAARVKRNNPYVARQLLLVVKKNNPYVARHLYLGFL